MPQLRDQHGSLHLTCLSPLPPCSLLGDTETSPRGATKQTAHDFWPGHKSCRWTTGAASARGKRKLSFGEFVQTDTCFPAELQKTAADGHTPMTQSDVVQEEDWAVNCCLCTAALPIYIWIVNTNILQQWLACFFCLRKTKKLNKMKWLIKLTLSHSYTVCVVYLLLPIRSGRLAESFLHF